MYLYSTLRRSRPAAGHPPIDTSCCSDPPLRIASAPARPSFSSLRMSKQEALPGACEYVAWEMPQPWKQPTQKELDAVEAARAAQKARLDALAKAAAPEPAPAPAPPPAAEEDDGGDLWGDDDDD